ncbi:hypothetical protein Scep_006485 [Stephania cephalantha]|uniref:Uncharacterized protein n=1 Tax=Stephania cephalantha TaxID=152367 RepID=A0AAP0PK45_9MAGN
MQTHDRSDQRRGRKPREEEEEKERRRRRSDAPGRRARNLRKWYRERIQDLVYREASKARTLLCC